MTIKAIIDYNKCCTLKEIELELEVNYVPSCGCGSYFGDGGGKITLDMKYNKD